MTYNILSRDMDIALKTRNSNINTDKPKVMIIGLEYINILFKLRNNGADRNV